MQSLPFHKPFLAVMESVSDTSRYFKNGTLMPILPLFHLLQVKGAWMQERPSDIGGWGALSHPGQVASVSMISCPNGIPLLYQPRYTRQYQLRNVDLQEIWGEDF